MTDIKKKYLRISKGQISKQLIERTDIGILDASGQEITNWYNSKYGAIKTSTGTLLKYSFGTDKKIKLQNVTLNDGRQGVFVFNGTDHTMCIFNEYGNLISNIAVFNVVTEDNYMNLQLAQNEDLILVCTGDNPVTQIDISQLGHLTYNIFDIPMSKILKTNTITKETLNPICFRYLSNDIADVTDPESLGIEIGDYVYLNNDPDWIPDTTFPYSVKKLEDNTPTWSDISWTPNNNDVLKDLENNTTYQYIMSSTSYIYAFVNDDDEEIIAYADSQSPSVGNKIQIVKQGTITELREIDSVSGTTITTDGLYAWGQDGWNVATGYTTTTIVDETTQFYNSSSDPIALATFVRNCVARAYHITTTFSIRTISSFEMEGQNIRMKGQYAAGHNVYNYDVVVTRQTMYDTQGSYTRDSNYDLTNGYWVEQTTESEDIQLAGTYKPSATAGVITITLNNANFILTAPDGLDAKKYAESILIGVQFDGGDTGIGVLKITGITGTANGQNYTITKLKGLTEITFAGTDNYSGAKILTSQTSAFSGNYPNTDSNPTSRTNYPTNILFYQQRLVIAGTRYLGSQMLFSNTGKYDDFTDEGYSTSAFQLIIGSTQKETIKRVLVNQGIQIFTDVSEWLMNDQVISRTSGFVRNSQMGCNGVQPVISANGTSLFVPKNGKGIISFIYNYQSASYMTPYISLFTDVLDTPITDLCLKRGLDSQDDTLLFVTTEDGSLVIGNYLQEHDIQAFCVRKSGTATYKQSIQAENNVLLLIERNGVLGLELINNNSYTVCRSNDYSYNNTTGIINNLPDQYNGLEINVYDMNHKFIKKVLVEDNSATLSVEELPESLGEIGLNIHSVFISNPMNINATTYTRYKSIQRIELVLTEESKSEYLKINSKIGWRKDDMVTYIRPQRPMRKCQFTIENDIYPCEILSMEVTLEY